MARAERAGHVDRLAGDRHRRGTIHGDTGVTPHPAIKHIVVVMMENRSFDHVLGLMKQENPEIRGVLGDDYFNVAYDDTIMPVSDGAVYQGQLLIDPGHE